VSTATKLDQATSDIALASLSFLTIPLDVQAFDSNLAVARNQIIGNFVLVLTPAVRHPSMYPGHTVLSLLAVAAAFFLPGYRALCAPKFGEFLFEVSRVGNLLAVRRRDEVSQSYIQANGGKDISHGRDISNIRRDDQEPFVGLALDRKRLDLAFNFPMKTNANRPNVLNIKPVALEPDTITVTREENRVEAIPSFKPRVTWFFARLYSTEEIRERFIQTTQRSLCTTKVNRSKPTVILPLVLETAGLIGIASRNLPLVVEPLTLRQVPSCRVSSMISSSRS
jgi:hypothetical protein